MGKKNKPCPFCELDKQVELFYYDRWKNIIICRASQDSGFKYRLLAVRAGKDNHKPLPTIEERSELMIPLIAVAEALIGNGKASGYDVEEVVKEEHYHYYCNIT